MRRFALSTLKDFGMGKRITEGKIIEECRYLIEEFEQHEGNMISPVLSKYLILSTLLLLGFFSFR